MFKIFNRRKPFIDLVSEDFEREIKNNKNAVILDVRTPGEFIQGKIAGAINLDIRRGDFETQIITLDKDKTYYVYCFAGNRSIAACSILGSNGFRSFNLVGGIQRWK